jgi:hypothetical protein
MSFNRILSAKIGELINIWDILGDYFMWEVLIESESSL